MRDSSAETRAMASMDLPLPLPRRRLEVAVSHPRRLSAPEWILVEILQAFALDPPPLEVCASELGLPDVSVLKEARACLLREGVLEQDSDGQEARELKGLSFTALGQEYLKNGCVPGKLTWHPLDVDLDPITGTLVDKPRDVGTAPRAAESRVAEVLSGVPQAAPSLAKVRKWVGKHRADLLAQDGVVVDARWAGGGEAPEAARSFGWTLWSVDAEWNGLAGDVDVRVKGHGRAERLTLLKALYPDRFDVLEARVARLAAGGGLDDADVEQEEP